ncbi:hypothetical protein [Nonomuraea sp. 10N515B]|uniref:hypothetical protein n=1 Tax=Nonomuraea sp. 10N515B TaxID=3457422 RepID=UPI003FCCD8C9
MNSKKPKPHLATAEALSRTGKHKEAAAETSAVARKALDDATKAAERLTGKTT